MHQLIGWGDMLVFLNYGEQFLKMRKLTHQPFTRKGTESYRELQIRLTHVLLHDLLGSPQNYAKHVQRFTTAMMMEIAYGHRVVSDDDTYLRLVDEAIRVILDSGNIGLSIVDVFPFSGGETMGASIVLVIFAMLHHPEAQAKAQKEIDRVIGTSRLPDFSDRESLPMVECVIQESLRWNQPAPLAVPHCTRDDDVYNGMFIPKGSLIFPNAVFMCLDERIYSNPKEFWPERYLPKPQGNGEPHSGSTYGFGRRTCPGKYLADAGLYEKTIFPNWSIERLTSDCVIDRKTPVAGLGNDLGEDGAADARPDPTRIHWK
ncbi:hypothetical protein NLI96_g7942 [Meripilus lineatus]|uniref:Cytochrome P450 n=1 Tax=Meripilus lineatus TaxID=2056292 RepID=A0AAD5YBK4_9APHY|nr:hypothetical protein NLI96_g7942 [Physisporinus lineatus]